MHTWKLPYGGIVSDKTHAMYYRGQKVKEAWYRGDCVWRKDKNDGYDVIVYDWDGTILAHWSAEQFLKFKEIPQLHRTFYPPIGNKDEDIIRTKPAYDGEKPLAIVPAGYNWTFEAAVSQVKQGRFCDIGCLYNSGNITYLWVKTTGELPLVLKTSKRQNATVDWGDGTQGVIEFRTTSHTYSDSNMHLITITADSLCFGYIGSGSGEGTALSGAQWISSIKNVFYHGTYTEPASSGNRDNVGCEFKALFLGDTGNMNSPGTYKNAEFLYIGFSENVPSITQYGTFEDCYYLRHLTFPTKVKNVPQYNMSATDYNMEYGSLYAVRQLKSISYPYTWIGGGSVYGALSLERIVLPIGTQQMWIYVNLPALKVGFLSGGKTSSNMPGLTFRIGGTDHTGLVLWCTDDEYDSMSFS